MKAISIPKIFHYLGLVLASMFFLLPIYLVLVTALKEPNAITLETAWQLPKVWNWSSFSEAWTAFFPKMKNSFVLTFFATFLSAVIGSMNGYVLSKWRFPGANIIFPLILFGMFIPYQSILIPLTTLKSSVAMWLDRFDFFHNYIPDIGLPFLILTHIIYGLPITTLIFRNFYAEIPDELMEASRIDGAGFFAIYQKVIFPLSIPGFVVVIIWQFTQIWNEFLFAVTLVSNPSSQPITVALSQLAGGEAVKWNLPMAGALLAALPTLLVYIFLGKYFIRGLLAGSVKG